MFKVRHFSRFVTGDLCRSRWNLKWSCDVKGIFLCVTGEVLDMEGTIELEDVPVITPNGDVVVDSLSFQVAMAVSEKKLLQVPL